MEDPEKQERNPILAEIETLELVGELFSRGEVVVFAIGGTPDTPHSVTMFAKGRMQECIAILEASKYQVLQSWEKTWRVP